MSKGLNLNRTMLTIKSIVAFDLETTGLPSTERNAPKITELAMVACERDHCIFEKELPRVLPKLSVPVNPMKPVSYGAYRVSGLSNDILENSKCFDDGLVGLIKNFLLRLPQPVCLVAHNGKSFDFPIFQKHLTDCSEPFPETVYCADSVDAFKAIYPKNYKSYSDFGTREEDALCVEALEKLEKTLGASDPVSISLRQIVNESTPESKTNAINYVNYKKEVENGKVCRKLNLDGSEIVNDSDPNNKPNFPHTYRLRDIYRFLHEGNVFPDAHRAENDTVALLSCIVKCGKEFVEYLDKNAKLLSEIRPLR